MSEGYIVEQFYYTCILCKRKAINIICAGICGDYKCERLQKFIGRNCSYHL